MLLVKMFQGLLPTDVPSEVVLREVAAPPPSGVLLE
jgi:hypothetical protein